MSLVRKKYAPPPLVLLLYSYYAAFEFSAQTKFSHFGVRRTKVKDSRRADRDVSFAFGTVAVGTKVALKRKEYHAKRDDRKVCLLETLER